MDKNTLIVLGFLLLCIFLSLDKKEGFATINVSEFEEQCSDGHECIVTLSGTTGFTCSENPHSDNYNILGDTDGATIFSDPFILSLNAQQPCNSANADPDPNIEPSISACTSSDSPYELSGCNSKCTKPLSSDIYNLENAPLKVENTPDPIPNQSITCNSGFVNAANICFDKNTGAINPNRNQGDCVGPDNIWYDSAQGVKTYCPSPGEDYVIMGCEPTCLSRISHDGDYLMTLSEWRDADNLESTYQRGKELMQVTPHRNEGSIGIIRPLSTSPYNVNESGSSLDPNNFSVNITPGDGVITAGWNGTIDFEGVGVSEACNINSDNEDTRNKYFVKGLFPTCEDDEECLNFNISYNDGEEKPYNLEQLRDQLPTDIFQGDPSEDDIQKYKDSLYYFRGFMGSDGRYNVEGQIRCNTDSTSRYGCAIIPGGDATGGAGDPFTWSLAPLGTSCNQLCEQFGSTCSDSPDINYQGDDDEEVEREIRAKIATAIGETPESACDRVMRIGPDAPWSLPSGPIYRQDQKVCFLPIVDYSSDEYQNTYDCDYITTRARSLCKCQG